MQADPIKAVGCLVARGWTQEQAAGIVGGLIQNDALPPWRQDGGWRSQMMRDWCSSTERDADNLESQMAFIDYDLRNGMQAVGSKLSQAQTVEDAATAVAPYAKQLKFEPMLP